MERFVLFFVLFFLFLLCVCICRFFVMRLSKCVYQAPTPLEPNALKYEDQRDAPFQARPELASAAVQLDSPKSAF